MYLVVPFGRKQKWDVRVRLHDGRVVKVPGDRDESTAKRIGERVDRLIKAKQNGDPPPGDLQVWIDNMPSALSRRLIELGLLDQRRVDRLKPIEDQIKEFERIVAARKTNTAQHAKRTAGCVRRLLTTMKVTALSQITEDAVATTLLDLCKSPSTRRHYVIAVKDFTKWAARVGRVSVNPLIHLTPPSQYADPAIERVPLTVEQFRSLMKYMGTIDRYSHQIARWTGADRKLLYWTAVRTAFRQNELRSLRVASVIFDAKPAQIVVRAPTRRTARRHRCPSPPTSRRR